MLSAALDLAAGSGLGGWVVLLVVPLLGLLVARAVYRDARARGSGWAWQWAVAVAIGSLALVLGLLVLGRYWLRRPPAN